MILSNKRKTKVLNRLHGCTGWSAPVLFPYNKVTYSHDEAHMKAIDPFHIVTSLSNRSSNEKSIKSILLYEGA